VAGSRRRLLPLLLASSVVAAACRAAAPVDPGRLVRLDAALGQLLLVGFSGTSAAAGTDAERVICRVGAGAVVLFGRNIVSAEQLARLTAELQARARACLGRPVLVAVDAEGGRVMRLGPEAGWSAVLSAEELGWSNDLTLTELEARRVARRLRRAGITWNLAPVVDVGYNPANPVVVGVGRAFGANPLLVTAHARAFIRGHRAEGVLTTLKHFPGHGSSFHDSHRGLVDVTETANLEVELAPYRALLAEGLVDSVMTAHVFNRRLDPRYPATLSWATVSGLLRGALGFRGAVVSDDLRMAALEDHWGLERSAVLAVGAGVDILLVADDRLPGGGSAAEVVLHALRRALRAGRLTPAQVEAALERRRALEPRLAP
jgi:beta-N-acetylhexosaminidase